ncbi:MAG TPA: enoyl-ACP reductase FabI [Actinomycetota bacterium]|nr:enoyl-ACP reductase FabI [Actinomycetota bacterium]
MLLEGKRLLITGVLTQKSIAFAAARLAQEQGAKVVLSGFGKGMALTEMSARRLPEPPEILVLDVTKDDDIARAAEQIGAMWGGLDGFLHAVAFAPQNALGGEFLNTPWESVELAFKTSAFSLKSLATGLMPLMESGSSIVSLDFDGRVAWPIYDWMGVCKAGLESITRYLARDLGPRGIRVNTVSAGPLATTAAKGIPGFDQLVSAWGSRAPLGWAPDDPLPVAKTVGFLLSDWSAGITGELIHVDGGYHAMGAEMTAG